MQPARAPIGLVPIYTDPFKLMREFTEEMDRLFGSTKNGELGVWYPALEFVRRNGHVRITAHLPDVLIQDVRVFVHGRALVLEGERRFEDGKLRETKEMLHGSFRREIPLPEGLNPEDVTARFAEGVLIVEFPFREVKPHAVPIQSVEGTP